MNGNSSKQVLLSVLGIAILVVAVVGVSFAFFSYTKTGTTINTITTGEIYTYMNTGDTMMLTDAMPVETDPTSIVDTTTNDVGALSFTITGKNQSDSDITYKVYLVPGLAANIPVGKTELLNDSDIGVLMKSTSTGGTPMTNISSATTVGALITANGGTTLSDGALLGTGIIPKHTNNDITHSYTINMWVRGETVKISDTDAKVNGVATKYCAHAGNTNKTVIDGTSGNTTDTKHGCEQNLPIWSSAYYMAKVRVVANTNAANTGVNYGS